MPQVLLHGLIGMKHHGDASRQKRIEDALASGAVAGRLQAEDGLHCQLVDRLGVFVA